MLDDLAPWAAALVFTGVVAACEAVLIARQALRERPQQPPRTTPYRAPAPAPEPSPDNEPCEHVAFFSQTSGLDLHWRRGSCPTCSPHQEPRR